MENSGLINHPTIKNGSPPPKSVIMLLLGESKRQYADMLAVAHDPVFDARAEIWTCNAGFRCWQHDLVFVMDDLEGEAYKWPRYGEDLAAHDKPIITSTAYPAWPNATAYPYSEVVRRLRLQGLDQYFFNSVPYMLAYALALGVEQITLFGADYWHPSQGAREADLANAEWWLGFARGRGVNIVLSQHTTLMSAHANRALYGYRFDPRVRLQREQVQAPGNSNLSQGARELIEQAAHTHDSPIREAMKAGERDISVSIPDALPR